jgi:hypothetical protein
MDRAAHAPWTAKAVGELVLNEYPPLAAELGKEGPGLWARLMYLESSAIVTTLGDLMAKGIPALPVHDSVIVPATGSSFKRSWLWTGIGKR